MIKPDQLYDIACEVAESDAKDSAKVIRTLSSVFKNNLRTV